MNKQSHVYSAKSLTWRVGVGKSFQGLLTQVSGGKSVWGIDKSGYVWKRPVDGSGAWKKTGGKRMKYVDGDDPNFLWGVGSDGSVQKCKKPCDSGGRK